MEPHILAAISAHGFGHLAQVAPVINACQQMVSIGQAPAFRLTVRSDLDPAQIGSRIGCDFAIDSGTDDFGMVMLDALRVDVVKSLERYAALHREWPSKIDKLARHLGRLELTGLIADTPYLTLAAAKAANIPSIAICSLNWADILEGCIRQTPGALREAGVSAHLLSVILQQMRDAYASATLALSPEPAIPTTGFQTIAIEPLADLPAVSERTNLLNWVKHQSPDYLGGNSDCWLVLTSMGGLDFPLEPARWPTRIDDRPVVYLIDPAIAGHCAHTVGYDLNQFGFRTLIASCDIVLTKPGYGMFVESAACGKALLYLERNQWPESRYLKNWANLHINATELSVEQIKTGDFANELEQLLRQPSHEAAHFKGAQTAAAHVCRALLKV